jgi:hypothetical protein
MSQDTQGTQEKPILRSWHVGADGHARLTKIKQQLEQELGLGNIEAHVVASRVIDFYLASHPLPEG